MLEYAVSYEVFYRQIAPPISGNDVVPMWSHVRGPRGNRLFEVAAGARAVTKGVLGRILGDREMTDSSSSGARHKAHRVLNGRWVVHSLRRRRGMWRGRVRDLKNGRVLQRDTHERDRRKAEQAILDWIRLLESRENSTTEPLTERFDLRFQEWMELKSLRPSSKFDLHCSFRGVFCPTFGERFLDEISPKDIERFLKALETKRRLASKTRQKHLTTLRSFFSWAVRHKHCAENPTLGIKVPRGAKRQGTALTVEEARRLIQACHVSTVKEVKDRRRGTWKQTWDPPEHLALAVHIALQTGLRRGNILNLRWSQVDLQKGSIVIAAEETKAQADLRIPIHPELIIVLQHLQVSRGGHSKEDLVLGTKLRAITKSFKAALARAQLPPIRWHDLRHTFATWASLKAPYAVLRELLGHSPGSVTFHYTHVPFEELQRVVRELPVLQS